MRGLGLDHAASCVTTHVMASTLSPSTVVLSPHHDDAALSLGLTLLDAAEAGEALHILNVFTVSAHSPQRAAQGVAEISTLRAEESSACHT